MSILWKTKGTIFFGLVQATHCRSHAYIAKFLIIMLNVSVDGPSSSFGTWPLLLHWNLLLFYLELCHELVMLTPRPITLTELHTCKLFSHAGFSPWLLHVPHHDETTLSDLASLVPFCLHFLIFLVPLLLSLAFALLCLPCLYQSLVGYFLLVKLLTRV